MTWSDGTAAMLQEVLDFTHALYRNGHDGKTVVVGYRPDGQVTAFAYGLEHEQQISQLEMIARVVFAQHAVHRYVVLVPAWGESLDVSDSDPGPPNEVIAVQGEDRQIQFMSICPVLRSPAGQIVTIQRGEILTHFKPIISSLLAPAQRIPGRLLRTVRQAYEELKVDVHTYMDK
jgi:hypothetical protein